MDETHTIPIPGGIAISDNPEIIKRVFIDKPDSSGFIMDDKGEISGYYEVVIHKESDIIDAEIE